MKRSVGILFILFAVTLSHSQHPAERKIDSLLTYYESKNEFMGSVTLAQNGKIFFDKAYGFADASVSKKATPLTRYKIGSITKMFTAAVIFQLIEEKKLALDTKLDKFFPQVRNSNLITMGNLLGHRSGIFNYTDDPAFGSFMYTPHSRADIVSKISKYPEHFAPDSKSEYSNSNYMLLGFIIEDITKKGYWENVQARIIKKTGLKNTGYGGIINPAINEAFSYKRIGDSWSAESPWDMSLAGPAGAIVATTADLTVFLDALFNGKIVSPASLEQMKTLQDGYGKGMFQVPFDDKRAYGHNGGIEEFVAQAYYFPEDKLAIAMCANAKGGNNNDIAIGILSYLFYNAFKFPNLDPVNVAVDSAILDSYTGTYSSTSFPLKVTISTVDGVLHAQATGQSAFPLDAVSNTEFTFKQAGINISFEGNNLVLKQGGMQNILKKE